MRPSFLAPGEKLYASRDRENLRPYFMLHLDAMTGEGLHSKFEIADELAFRDKTIEALRREIAAQAVMIEAQAAEILRWRTRHCNAMSFIGVIGSLVKEADPAIADEVGS